MTGAAGAIEGDSPPAVDDQRQIVGDHATGERAELDILGRETSALRATGENQQLLDDRLHALHVAGEIAEEARLVRRVEARAQDRDRREQLMRGVGRKASLPPGAVLEPRERGVDRLEQGRDLLGRFRGVDALVDGGKIDLREPLLRRIERRQSVARRQPGADDRKYDVGREGDELRGVRMRPHHRDEIFRMQRVAVDHQRVIRRRHLHIDAARIGIRIVRKPEIVFDAR